MVLRQSEKISYFAFQITFFAIFNHLNNHFFTSKIHFLIRALVITKDAFVANKPVAGTLIIDDSSGPLKSRSAFTGSIKRMKEKNELAEKLLS